jgi:predicted SAM-dependent methyltransferase
MKQKTESTEALLVNVGCGLTRPDGWINTDSSINSLCQGLPYLRPIWRRIHRGTSYDRPASYLDLRFRWPFNDKSVAVLYASHVFEHLSISKRRHFLDEAKRVLKIGGVIRIVVPDLEQLAATYVTSVAAGETRAAETFLGFINLHAENAYSPNRNMLTKLINVVQGKPHQHKYMYDKRSLAALLSESGFEDVRFDRYGSSAYIPQILDVEYSAEGVASIYGEAIWRRGP